MRADRGPWGPPHAKRHGPGRPIGFRIFGFLFFLLFVSAIIGGLIAWLATPSRGWFLLAGFLVIVAFFSIMRRMFLRAWAPISRLIDATTRLGEGDTTVRMARSNGPWNAVSASFNRMAERLEAEEERRRRLLADLGHELRTPLTVIRGEIEAVIDGVHEPGSLNNVVDEVELMDRLLEDLRTLALAESGGLQLVVEPTDLGELAADVADSFASVMTAQGVELVMQRDSAGTADVDPHRIHQVVANLVSNALAHMRDGGTLEVIVDGTEITVADTGRGLPGDTESVFDRFVKAADSAGSGLGLSIARDLVEAHGGTITAANRREGGARFTVALETRRPPDDPTASGSFQ